MLSRTCPKKTTSLYRKFRNQVSNFGAKPKALQDVETTTYLTIVLLCCHVSSHRRLKFHPRSSLLQRRTEVPTCPARSTRLDKPSSRNKNVQYHQGDWGKYTGSIHSPSKKRKRKRMELRKVSWKKWGFAEASFLVFVFDTIQFMMWGCYLHERGLGPSWYCPTCVGPKKIMFDQLTMLSQTDNL